MTNALIEIRDTAEAHGWRVHRVPEIVGNPYEFRRTYREDGRQRTEYLSVCFDVLDQVTYASWAPSLDGAGGKHPLSNYKTPVSNSQLHWVLSRLRAGRSS